ncbi:hypothetical protein FQR65_LT11931 [Abscondita terminalis]|nr:hypothetical protein FQR65_LT11931 [Abscondita terminalis]
MSLVAKCIGGKRLNFSKRSSYTARVHAAALAHLSGPAWHLQTWEYYANADRNETANPIFNKRNLKSGQNLTKTYRKRVATGAEVITTEEIVVKLKEKQKEKDLKQKKTNKDSVVYVQSNKKEEVDFQLGSSDEESIGTNENECAECLELYESTTSRSDWIQCKNCHRFENLEIISFTDLTLKWGKEKKELQELHKPIPLNKYCHPISKREKTLFQTSPETDAKNFALLSTGDADSAITTFINRALKPDNVPILIPTKKTVVKNI